MAAFLEFISCPFDLEVGEERLSLKRAYAALSRVGLPPDAPRDPGEVLKPYALRIPGVSDGGCIHIDDWLRPSPVHCEPSELSVERACNFARRNGCRDVAQHVRERIEAADASVSLMVGVDHSASGGAIEAFSAVYGRDDLVVIVMDSHFDAVPGDIRQGLLAYGRENVDAFGDLASCHAPFADASQYDCGSFLSDLIARGVIAPQNLIVLGCADMPAARLESANDARVQRYLAYVRDLQSRDVRIVTRDELLAAADPRALVQHVTGSYADRPVYLSVDMDIGAQRALAGVRFLEQAGLPEDLMQTVFEAALEAATGNGNWLVGLDLMEFDFYQAGAIANGRQDRTYDIALNLIETTARRLQHTQRSAQWNGLRASA